MTLILCITVSLWKEWLHNKAIHWELHFQLPILLKSVFCRPEIRVPETGQSWDICAFDRISHQEQHQQRGRSVCWWHTQPRINCNKLWHMIAPGLKYVIHMCNSSPWCSERDGGSHLWWGGAKPPEAERQAKEEGQAETRTLMIFIRFSSVASSSLSDSQFLVGWRIHCLDFYLLQTWTDLIGWRWQRWHGCHLLSCSEQSIASKESSGNVLF